VFRPRIVNCSDLVGRPYNRQNDSGITKSQTNSRIERSICGAKALVYEQTPEDKSRIEQLRKFIEALRRWQMSSTFDEGRGNLRSFINDNIFDVREAVQLAGCGVTLTATPPPITGGLILRGLDPFDHIFDPPYGIDVIPKVIDVLERTMAKIRSGKAHVQRKSPSIEATRPEKTLRSSKKIFLVHGHDVSAQQTVARFLEKLGLEPIILSERPSSGDTLIEKMERYSDVAFAVVLLTPDDLGGENKASPEVRPRARQNVILELGYFMGKLGREKVAALLKGDLERPSDYDGVNYVPMEGAWQLHLAQELQAAGLKVDLNSLIKDVRRK
jgi:predicted nucleotide-binding protein